MSNQGIKITDLRPEIQTLVNSNPDRYDPNKNGRIDDGDELSQLLSEYQTTESNLVDQSIFGGPIYTTAEQVEINEKVAGDKSGLECASGALGVFGVIAGIVGVLASQAKTFKGALKGTGGKVMLGSVLFGITGFLLARNHNKKLEALEIKARQAEQGQKIMENKRKQEEEMRQREEALKQEELEYRERMNTATSGIEQNISTADKKAKSVNRELSKIKEQITAKNDSTTVAN